MNKPARTKSAVSRAVRIVEARPVLISGVVAALARAVAVVVLGMRSAVTIPDEGQYLFVARVAAQDKLTPQTWGGYGWFFQKTLIGFLGPIEMIMRVFGPSRYGAQIFVATCGVVTVVAVAATALRFTTPLAAGCAGLLAALLPSQILWSSVVLREAQAWACLSIIAFCLAVLATTTSTRSRWLAVVTVFPVLLVLAKVRAQTAVMSSWAVMLALIVLVAATFRSPKRPSVVASAIPLLLAALAAPALTGQGLGGISLIARSGGLAVDRTYGSMEANSTITNATVIPAPTTTVTTTAAVPPSNVATSPTQSAAQPAPASPRVLAVTSLPFQDATPAIPAPTDPPVATTLPEVCKIGERVCVTGYRGEVYLVDDSAAANIRHFPTGLVAVLLRPMLFERNLGGSLMAAAVENLAWLVLYVLAVIGLWRSRRQLPVIAFPFFVAGMIAGAAALTQGNLGTAFRHRGQIFWAVALFAAVPLANRLKSMLGPDVATDPEDAGR